MVSLEVERALSGQQDHLAQMLKDDLTAVVQIECDAISLSDIRTSKTLVDVIEKARDQLRERIKAAGAIPERSWWMMQMSKSDPFRDTGKFVVECRVLKLAE